MSDRFLIDGHSCHGIFESGAGAVENGNFVVAGSTGFFAGDDFGELGVDVFFSHQAAGDGVMGVADRAGLVEAVGDDFRRSHQRRIDFLFVSVVGADGGDEHSRRQVFVAHEKFSRGRACDANVAALERGGQIVGRSDRETEFFGEGDGEIFSSGLVGIERKDFV